MSSSDLEIRIIARDGSAQVLRGVVSNLDAVGSSAKRNGLLLADSMGKEVAFRDFEAQGKALRKEIDASATSVKGLAGDLKQGFATAFVAVDVALTAVGSKLDEDKRKALELAKGATAIGTSFLLLGPVGALMSGLGLLVGALVADMERADAEAKKIHDDMVKPFEDAKKQVQALNPPIDELVTSLEKALGVSEKTAKGIAEVAKSDQAYRDSLLQDIALQEKLVEKQKELETARRSITPNRAGIANPEAIQQYRDRVYAAAAAEDELAVKTEHAASVAKIHSDSLNAEKAALEYLAFAARNTAVSLDPKADRDMEKAGSNVYAVAAGRADGIVDKLAKKQITLKQALTDLNGVWGLSAAQVDMYTGKLIALDGQAQLTANSMALLAGNVNAMASMGEAVRTADGWMGRLGVSTQATGDMEARGKAITDDMNASQKRLAEEGLAKAKAAWEQLRSAIRGAVESAITPTSVTDEDKKATAMGTYVDKWDEFRRRVEAVASGTPMGAFGEKFASELDALKAKTGLTFDAISAKFKNFSLFADKSNLKLIDWDAVVGSTKDAVDAIIGKYNVVTEGVKAYLESDQGKAQLPQLKLALGLDAGTSTSDVQKALTGALGGTAGPGGEQGSFKATVSLDAKKAITDATTLKGLIADIPASKGGVTVSTTSDLKKSATFDATLAQIVKDLDQIPTAADIVVTMTYVVNGTPPTGGTNTSGTSGGGGGPKGRWTGGYVDNGLYRLGEAGREYVLPHGLVEWIEKMLGGPITNDQLLAWLPLALDKGETEARNQFATFAATQTGSMVELPKGLDRWLSRTYSRYNAKFGTDLSGSSGSSGGGAVGGGGGGDGGGSGLGGDLTPVVSNLQKIYGVLVDIRAAVGGGALSPHEPRRLNVSGATPGTLSMHGYA